MRNGEGGLLHKQPTVFQYAVMHRASANATSILTPGGYLEKWDGEKQRQWVVQVFHPRQACEVGARRFTFPIVARSLLRVLSLGCILMHLDGINQHSPPNSRGNNLEKISNTKISWFALVTISMSGYTQPVGCWRIYSSFFPVRLLSDKHSL